MTSAIRSHAFGLGHLAHDEPVADVVADRQVREQRVVLEDRVHVAIERRDRRHVPAVEVDAAGRRQLEPRDHPQRRRLARTRRAEHREELAVAHLEVDAGDREHVAVALLDALEADRVPPVVDAGVPGPGRSTVGSWVSVGAAKQASWPMRVPDARRGDDGSRTVRCLPDRVKPRPGAFRVAGPTVVRAHRPYHRRVSARVRLAASLIAALVAVAACQAAGPAGGPTDPAAGGPGTSSRAARGQPDRQGLPVPARRARAPSRRDRPAARHQRWPRGPRGDHRRCHGPGRLGGR